MTEDTKGENPLMSIEVPMIMMENGSARSALPEEIRKGARPRKEQDAAAQAEAYRDSGSMRIIVSERSATPEGREKSLAVLQDLCRRAVIPVIVSSAVTSLSDIRDILDAGSTAAAFPVFGRKDTELLREAGREFGKDRIGVFITVSDQYRSFRKEIEESASFILCNSDTADVLGAELVMPAFVRNPDGNSFHPLNFSLSFESPLQWSDFKLNSDGMVPCIVQDAENGDVLMMAYMNEESFLTTLRTGRMTYWSRSRNELWMKGLTSGHLQFVRELYLDCDNDTLLAKVIQIGAACHTGRRSCFFQKLV